MNALQLYDYITSRMNAVYEESGAIACEQGNMNYALEKLEVFLKEYAKYKNFNEFKRKLFEDIKNDPEYEMTA